MRSSLAWLLLLLLLLLDAVVLGVVARQQRVAGALGAVVVLVGVLDPAVDEEAEVVRGEVERQHDEVEQVVVVQQVDADARAVHLLALDPQQTCIRSDKVE